MKILSTTIACLAASLLLGAFAVADEVRKVKLVFVNDEAQPVVFEGDELGLGETRHVNAEDGTPLTLTRTEKGYSIEVEGRTIELAMPEIPGGGQGQGFRWVSADVEGAEGGDGAVKKHQVIIHEVKGGGDAEIEVVGPGAHKVEKRIMVHGAPGDGKKTVRVIVEGKDGEKAELKARLLASGALDGLDDASRQKVLDALGDRQN